MQTLIAPFPSSTPLKSTNNRAIVNFFRVQLFPPLYHRDFTAEKNRRKRLENFHCPEEFYSTRVLCKNLASKARSSKKKKKKHSISFFFFFASPLYDVYILNKPLIIICTTTFLSICTSIFFFFLYNKSKYVQLFYSSMKRFHV